MQRTALATLAFCALGWAAPIRATTALVNGSGQLIGVADLPVLGSIYNVSLVEGSCASLFGGCDDSGDFDFNSDVIAMFAAQALLDQGIPGEPFGPFHDDPSLMFGCQEGVQSCTIIIPYEVSSLSSSFVGARLAFIGTFASDEVRGPSFIDVNFDTTAPISIDGAVYARFTLASAAVPEPSTWAMMLLGLGAVGIAMRRLTRAGISLPHLAQRTAEFNGHRSTRASRSGPEARLVQMR